MTSAIRVPKWLKRITDLDANPVWVKDLRQAARSKVIPGLLVILTLGFYAISALVIFVGNRAGFEDSHPGQPMFESISLLQMGVSFVFIPVYCFCRTFAERVDSQTDLFYITAMSPKQIMEGKSLSVIHLSLLFYSTALPFLFVSYLMRGIDLPSIFLTLFFLFSVNLLLALGAVVLALQNWEVVPKITIASVLGTTVLLSTISQGFDFIQNSTISTMREDPGESFFLIKAGVYVLLWCVLYKILILHGTHLIKTIASMGPQPLLRFSMKPRPEKRKHSKKSSIFKGSGQRTAAAIASSTAPSLGEMLIRELAQSQSQKSEEQRDINPVLHKDYTQSSRNPYIVGILLLVLCTFYVTTSFIVYYNPNMYLGVTVFNTISKIISLTSCLFIPVYFFARVIGEEISKQRELVLISELSAGQILRGKFLSAFHILSIFSLVASPFIVASNLFHGIDLHTILLKLETAFLASLLLTTGAIILGFSRLSISSKTIACACGVLALLFVPRFMDISWKIPLPAPPDSMETWPIWVWLTVDLFYAALVIGFLYTWGIGFLTPSVFNQALPFRGYASLMLLLINAKIVTFAWIGEDLSYLKNAIYLNAVVLKFGLLINLCKKDSPLSVRIRGELPHPYWKRILLFPFSKGRFPGIMWLLGLWTLLCAFSLTFADIWKGTEKEAMSQLEALRFLTLGMSVFVIYCFSFSLISRVIQHHILKGTSIWTGGALYMAMLTFPSILMETFRQQGWLNGSETIPGVILSLRVAIQSQDFTTISPHLYYSLILSGTGLALNFKWIFWQIRRFSPLPT